MPSRLLTAAFVLAFPAQPAGPLAHIPAADFQMGIDASEVPSLMKTFGIGDPRLFDDEIPQHRVTLRAFEMDRYLATNAEFRKFVEANPRWQPGHLAGGLDNGNYLKHWQSPGSPAAQPDHPVVNVNWYAASAFCQWAGKRLPSEAEWAWAARGGSRSPSAVRTGAGTGTTSKVGAYAANGYGLFDMTGNVWQFLADDWHAYGIQSAPARERRVVIRGGSYEAAPVNLWLECRDSHPANGSREFVGFRCAR